MTTTRPPVSIRALAAKALLAALALGANAMAQTPSPNSSWPDRPIRIITAYGPGSSPDNAMRKIAIELSKALGQPVIVDPRPGAGGRIAAAEAAHAAPDGYTFAYSDTGPMMTLPATGAKLAYSAQKDFVPVVRTSFSYPYIIAPAGSAAQTLGDLKNLGHAPAFGLSGLGTFPHMICLAAAKAAGFECNPVPYSKGTTAALMDVAGGTLDLGIAWGSDMVGFLESRKIRLLATMAPARNAKYPDVPSIGEAFPSAARLAIFTGIFAPTGTPASIIERLRIEINKVMVGDVFKPWTESVGGTVEVLDGPGFTRFLDEQRLAIKTIVDAYGLKSE